jgi:hypothetical protein
MEVIQIGVDFKEVQRKNTEAEIKRMINSGIEQISIEDMQQKLATIGLTLDLNENSYLYLYYNTSNENSYLEATTSPIDNKKISAYNTNSEFYNKHLRGDIKFYTPMGEALQKMRNNYFCTFTKRKQTYILSF